MNQNNNPGCLFGFLSFFFPKKKRKAQETNAQIDPMGSQENARDSYADCYQSKYLLTKNEWYAHKKLKSLADEKGLIICPKVRMLDIVEPKKGEKDWKALFYKIQAKHLDFVICNNNMHIIAILELDDTTHDMKDRKERDYFVDEVLQSVGYRVIRTRYITDDILDDLDNTADIK